MLSRWPIYSALIAHRFAVLFRHNKKLSSNLGYPLSITGCALSPPSYTSATCNYLEMVAGRLQLFYLFMHAYVLCSLFALRCVQKLSRRQKEHKHGDMIKISPEKSLHSSRRMWLTSHFRVIFIKEIDLRVAPEIVSDSATSRSTAYSIRILKNLEESGTLLETAGMALAKHLLPLKNVIFLNFWIAYDHGESDITLLPLSPWHYLKNVG